MATKVLSIEIGQGLTRVVEMDYKAKNPKIYNCFTFVTPKGVMNDGIVSCTDTFVSLMKTEFSKWSVTTKKVVYSVTSSRIASREVKLPLVKDKQIQEVLNANAADFFPVDMNQYHLSYKVLKKVNQGKEKALHLSVLAVPNEVTNSYVKFAEACGLQLQAIDYVGNSVTNAMQDVFKEGVHAVVKVEERLTLITILEDGRVTFQRSVKYGIEGAIDVVRKTPAFANGANNLTYGEAIDVLCGKTCIRKSLQDEEEREEEDVDMNMMRARIAVTRSLRGLIASIVRLLEYYQESNNAKIDNIHLIGLGGDFSGLSRLLSNEMQQKARVFRGKEGSNIEKTVRDNKFTVSSYVACVGAAMTPMNLLPPGAQKGSKDINLKDLKSLDNFKTGIVVGVICIIISLSLVAISLMNHAKAEKEVEAVRASIEQLRASGAEMIYIEYIKLSRMSEELISIYGSTLSRSENLVAFIEELEEKMPSSMIVMNFSASAQGVNMGMTVDSKEAVAKTILQLKTFDSVEVISTSGLTENEEENGDKTVTFSVNLTYKPVGAEEEEAEAEAYAEAQEAAVEEAAGTEAE